MEQQETDSGITEAVDTVEAHEATDEEIEAFLSSPDGEGAEDDSDSDALATGRGEEDLDSDDEQAELEVEEKEDGEDEKPGEREGEQSPEKYVSKEEFEKLLKEQKEQAQQLETQRRFIDRRNTELGETRKKLQLREQQLREVIKSGQFEDDPEKQHQLLRALDETRAGIKEVDNETEAQQFRQNNQAFVSERIDPKEVSLQEMVEVLAQDNPDQNYLRQFAQDPYGMATGPELLQLQRRARAEKALRYILPRYRKLEEQLKKAKNKPDEVLRNVEKASRQVPRQSARSSGSGKRKGMSQAFNPVSASDDELERFLRE